LPRAPVSWDNNDVLVSAELRLVEFRGFTGPPHFDIFSQGADNPADLKALTAPLAGPGTTATRSELVVALFGHTKRSGRVSWQGSTHVVHVSGTPGSGSSMVDIGWGVTSGRVDRTGEGITEQWSAENQAQTLTASFSDAGEARAESSAG
jgi:hypothetical protein